MGITRKTILALAVALTAMFGPVESQADWDPGDPNKMHFPQLPDANGWDVLATFPITLADDWLCTGTGPVSDIHVWGSWKGGEPVAITEVFVAIFDNIAADDNTPYSRPGNQVWDRVFDPNQLSLRSYGDGNQGWYDPETTEWALNDHFEFHQINIEGILSPFVQEQGHIYWLGISVLVESNVPGQWGWKTSLDHFEDNAAWNVFPVGNAGIGWQPLFDPNSGEPLDLAFVITPEPATMALLGIGGLAALIRRRR